MRAGMQERPEALLGQTIADRYVLEEIIGQGGIGVVYKAKHTLMNRTVAIKMLRSESMKDERNRQRFQQEAQAISSMNHPNIVSVFDFGFTKDNDAFLVMDYLDGQDLDTMIQEQGYLTPEEVVPIFTQICDAMTKTHEQGIIHRDLKPGNIIIIKKDGKSEAKLVDFGMVKFEAQAGRAAQALTQPGEVFGSPYYMSPEQCTGLKLDARSDIYSMGVLMYEAVTGRPPFLASNMAEMAQMHIYEKPDPIAQVINDQEFPEWMETIISKALEKNVDDRYQSTEELKQALLNFNRFWLEKEKAVKPVSLRQTTTSRYMKDEMQAAIKAALAKREQEDAEKSPSAAKVAAAAPAPAPAPGKSSGKSSGKQGSKQLLTLLGGAILGGCIAVTSFVLLGRQAQQTPSGTATNGEPGPSRRWQDLDAAGQYALMTGKYSEAERCFNQAVRQAARDGDNNPALISTLSALASVYEKQGKYDMAETVYKQTIHRIEKTDSPNSVNLAPVLMNLGSLYTKADKLQDADTVHKRAIAIIESAFGHEDPRLLECLTAYADTKRKQGHQDEARKMDERAAKIRKANPQTEIKSPK